MIIAPITDRLSFSFFLRRTDMTKMLFVSLAIIATLPLCWAEAFAQDFGQRLSERFNQENIGNNIRNSVRSQLQEGFRANPPNLNQTNRPDLRFNSGNQFQQNLRNAAQLRLQNLDADLRQRLNLGADGDLGVSLGGVNGLTVNSVAEGSLANQIGLSQGDQILAVNNGWVQTSSDVSSQLNNALANDGYAWLYVRRNGEEQWVRYGSQQRTKPTVGIRIETRNNQVVVTNITENSPAAEAGLQEGDIIVGVNNKTVHNNAEVVSEISNASADSQISFEIRRDEQVLTLQSRVSMPDEGGDNDGQPQTLQSRINEAQREFARIKKEFQVFANMQSDNESEKFQDLTAKINELSSELAVLRNSTPENLQESKPSVISDMEEIQAEMDAIAKTRTEKDQRLLIIMQSRVSAVLKGLRE
jgi:hypothetical protein